MEPIFQSLLPATTAAAEYMRALPPSDDPAMLAASTRWFRTTIHDERGKDPRKFLAALLPPAYQLLNEGRRYYFELRASFSAGGNEALTLTVTSGVERASPAALERTREGLVAELALTEGKGFALIQCLELSLRPLHDDTPREGAPSREGRHTGSRRRRSRVVWIPRW